MKGKSKKKEKEKKDETSSVCQLFNRNVQELSLRCSREDNRSSLNKTFLRNHYREEVISSKAGRTNLDEKISFVGSLLLEF